MANFDPNVINGALAQYQQQPAPSGMPSNEDILAAAAEKYGANVPAPQPMTQAPPAQYVAPDAMQQAPVVPQREAPKSVRQALSYLNDDVNATNQATSEVAKVQADQARQQADVMHQRAAELEGAAKQTDADMAAQRAFYDSSLNKYQDLNDKAQNMQVVDRRTTGNVVGGAIALAMAGLGDAMRSMGGNNDGRALQNVQSILDKKMEQDFQLQREKIANAKDAARSQLTIAGLARDGIQDVMHRDAWTKAQIQMKYGNALEELAARTADPMAKALAGQAAAQNKQQASGVIANLVQDDAAAAMNADAVSARLGMQQAQFGMQQQGQMFNQQMALNKSAMDQKEFELKKAKEEAEAKQKGGQEIDGFEYKSDAPLNPGDLAKAREIASGAAGVESSGKRLAGLYKEIQAAMDDGDEQRAGELRTRYWTSGSQYLVQRSLATGQGTVNQADAERDAKEGAIPPPPGSGEAIASKPAQWWKGTKPSAATIEQNMADTRGDAYERLAKYNYAPKSAGNPAAKQGGAPAGGRGVAGTAKPAGGTVSMVAPDGRQLNVPADQVERLKKLGAKVQ